MSRNRKLKNRKTSLSVSASEVSGVEATRTHFRRCHVCGNVTELEGKAVQRCCHCGKAMAPFYFFDESQVDPLSEFGVRPPLVPGARSPVRGLTAYW